MAADLSYCFSWREVTRKPYDSIEQQPTCKSVKRSITTSSPEVQTQCENKKWGVPESWGYPVHHPLMGFSLRKLTIYGYPHDYGKPQMVLPCRCQGARSPSTARFMALEPFTTNSPQSGTKTKPRQKSHGNKSVDYR